MIALSLVIFGFDSMVLRKLTATVFANVESTCFALIFIDMMSMDRINGNLK
jgi:hypothetical protein